jgi:hypothetical protein
LFNPRVGNPDHKGDTNIPARENEAIAARIEKLLTPLDILAIALSCHQWSETGNALWEALPSLESEPESPRISLRGKAS